MREDIAQAMAHQLVSMGVEDPKLAEAYLMGLVRNGDTLAFSEWVSIDDIRRAVELIPIEVARKRLVRMSSDVG
jgi:hypothetical protein